jgi:tRNA 2-thiouridine synthesizing protein C
MKSMLIITRQAPWSGPTAREALDIALAGGAFDLPIGILFIDDGVYQLCAGQQSVSIQQKDLTSNLQALELFGVKDLFVARSSLSRRGIEPTDALELQPVEDQELSALLARYDHMITL